MKHKKESRRLPLARKENLVVQELPGEILVYDLTRNKAHCLNGPAAIVWNHCNGERDVLELAVLLSKNLGRTVSEDVVLLALKQLHKAELMSEGIVGDHAERNVSRREVMRRLGAASALALPVVTSLVAPAAAQASSIAATCLACVTAIILNPCPDECAGLSGQCWNNNACQGVGGFYGTMTCLQCRGCVGNSNGWRAIPIQLNAARCCTTGNNAPPNVTTFC